MARSTKENVAVWKLLLLLSEGKGFSEAAFELSMDIAVCSRLIKRLEEELGMALVDHYSRPAKLTKEAASIIPAVRSYLQGWQRLQNACCASRNMPLSLKFSIPVNVPRRDPTPSLKTTAESIRRLSSRSFPMPIMKTCSTAAWTLPIFRIGRAPTVLCFGRSPKSAM